MQGNAKPYHGILKTQDPHQLQSLPLAPENAVKFDSSATHCLAPPSTMRMNILHNMRWVQTLRSSESFTLTVVSISIFTVCGSRF